MPHPAISPGRAAVVTGGAAGIGFAIASRLAKDGMAVAILDLGEERLAAAKEALEAAGAADVLMLEADVSDRAALERAFGANRIDYIFADISQPLDDSLFRYLSERERRNRTR